MPPGRISAVQMYLLSLPLVQGTGILFVPGLMAMVGGRDGWIAPLLAPAIVVAQILLLRPVQVRWPDLSFIQAGRILLGRRLGGLVGLFFAWWAFHTNSVILREFGEVIVTYVLPKTPLVAVHTLLLVAVVWAVRSGLEVISRCAEVLVPLNLFFLMLILTLTLEHADFAHLAPVLEYGLAPPLHAALIPMSWFGELLVLAFFWPRLQRPGQGGKVLLGASATIGVNLAYGTLVGISIFGPMAAKLIFAFVNIAQQVEIAEFIERIETPVVISWVADNFLKISLFHLAAIEAVRQSLGLRESRSLAIPAGVLLLVFSIVNYQSIPDVSDWLVHTFPIYGPLVELGVPAVIYLGFAVHCGRRYLDGA